MLSPKLGEPKQAQGRIEDDDKNLTTEKITGGGDKPLDLNFFLTQDPLSSWNLIFRYNLYSKPLPQADLHLEQHEFLVDRCYKRK